MATSLCPPFAQLGTNCNAISVGSRKDWDEYLQKRLGKVTLAPLFLVVIKEIVESPTDPRSSDLGKGQVPHAIGRLAPLVLALPVAVGPTSSPI